MAWIIESGLQHVLSLFVGIFKLFSEQFKLCFGINIGGNFSTIDKNVGLTETMSSYVNGNDTSLFASVIPLNDYKAIFVLLAVAIATLIFAFELTRVLSTPIIAGGERLESPGSLIGKYALSLVGIVMSYRIMILLEYIGNVFYLKFASINPGGMDASSMGSEAVAKGFEDFFNMESTVAGNIQASVMILVELFIAVALIIDFLKLMIEIIERYLVLGLLFYSAPVSFSTLASKSASNIFGAWCRMVASQLVLMMTNCMFINVFISCICDFSDKKLRYINGSENASAMSWIIFGLMLVAWLKLGQRFDNYLNDLGLSTARTGGQMSAAAGAFVGSLAARATKGMASGAAAVGGSIIGLGKSGFKKAENTQDKMTKAVSDFSPESGGALSRQQASMEAQGVPNSEAINNALNGGKPTELTGSGPMSRDAMANALNFPDAARDAMDNAASVTTDGDGRLDFSFDDGSTMTMDTLGRDRATSPGFVGAGNDVCISASQEGEGLDRAKDIINGGPVYDGNGDLNPGTRGYMAAERVQANLASQGEKSSIAFNNTTNNYEVRSDSGVHTVTPLNGNPTNRIEGTAYRVMHQKKGQGSGVSGNKSGSKKSGNAKKKK